MADGDGPGAAAARLAGRAVTGERRRSGALAEVTLDGGLPEPAGPPEPPARLHGDLWNGNVLWGADGEVRLIDPAAHGGHRETDLAMLRLFGCPQLGAAHPGRGAR
ncbi:Fructosamine kinase OS=Streptomyces fumanus OX=67302 GN=GCM10018772_19000 PE=4 SV=1 [Streptomyces fumanus]